MTIAMVGTPIALSLAVPLGTWLGTAVGWRTAFAVMSGLSVLLIAWILMVVPDYPGQRAESRIRLGSVIAMPGVRAVLAVVLLWMLGHNILYTYIAPFVERAGLGDRVDVVLLTFGIASLLGIWIAGQLVDRALRRAFLISLAVFALTAFGLGLFGLHSAAILVGAAIWGLTFGGAATLLQTALADTAGDGADVALSMNVVVWNAAIALGSVSGGILLDAGGAGPFPWAVFILAAAGFIVAFAAKKTGFRAGSRRA